MGSTKQNKIIKFQIVAALISAFALSAATWISTLQIPVDEANIDNEDSEIMKLQHNITNSFVNGLYAMDIQTERRIDLLHIDLEGMKTGSKSEKKQILLKELGNKTIEQIERWNSLFINDETRQNVTQIPDYDVNALGTQDIISLDQLLGDARRNAYSRLAASNSKIHSHELKKEGYKRTLQNKQTWFKFLQTFGLLTLLISFCLESYKKWEEK